MADNNQAGNKERAPGSEGPTMKQTNAAIETVTTALEPFPLDARRRVLQAVSVLLGVESRQAPAQQRQQGQQSQQRNSSGRGS